MSDITSALKNLESQIGHPAQTGVLWQITDKERNLVISYLTIKGVLNLQRNSNEVLSKLYFLPNYLSSALNNQKHEKGKTKPRISINSDLGDLDLEKQEPKTQLENNEELTNYKQKSAILEIVNQKIQEFEIEYKKYKDAIINTVHESVNVILTKSLETNREISEQIAKSTVEEQTKIQSEELKKLIEDIIFKSYRNQQVTNPPATEGSAEPEANSQINLEINNEFIPKIDPNYHFDPYAIKVIRSAISMQENLYVYGDTGCGKTTHLEQVCAVLNREIMRINPHDGITREMFLGGMKLINNETIFVEGALPLAMRNGRILLVDEISFLPPNLTAILNPIGEKGGKLYIPETSEWITPQPGFCIFATDNTGGKGDRTGNYTGTEVQNTATLDRFAFCLKMDYLPREKEEEILRNRFPNQSPDEIQRMLKLAQEIRSAFSRGELSLTLSTRKLIKFFNQRENNFSTQEALNNTILSWLDEDDENLVKTMIDRLYLLIIECDNKPLSNIQAFIKYIENNQIVSAIRIYRGVYGSELSSAKNMVEAIRDHRSPIPRDSESPLWIKPEGIFI